MSRHSERLVKNGYYRNDEEDRLSRDISYHETPNRRIFNKRMRAKKSRYSFSRTSSSRSSLFSDELAAEECLVNSCSDLDTLDMSSSLSTACSSSGYSSEQKNRRCYSGGFLAGFVSFLMDVLMLSRNTRHLRKPVIITAVMAFGLTLAFGFWFNPSVFMSLSAVCSCIENTFTLAQPFTSTKNAGTSEMEMLRDGIFSCVSQREAKCQDTWKREWESRQNEITLLKEIRLEQDHMIERWKTELGDLKTTMITSWLEQQIVEAKKQISELKVVLQGALNDLEKRLMDHFSVEMSKQREELLKSVRENRVALTRQDVEDTVQRVLRFFRADGIGMADFALESLGSTIIKSRCSESYQTNLAYFSLFGITLFYRPETPCSIIQPEGYPGKCWVFKGDQGFATIALAYPVYITHVTLEHLPKELSPTGHIYSTPKEFSVYGMRPLDEDQQLLGTFLYEYDGEPIQTFELLESVRDVFSIVQLRVRSNWGHADYTCIYRFRVHGQIQTP